jgi:hypothetical protein
MVAVILDKLAAGVPPDEIIGSYTSIGNPTFRQHWPTAPNLRARVRQPSLLGREIRVDVCTYL